jgi:hypothetical protein
MLFLKCTLFVGTLKAGRSVRIEGAGSLDCRAVSCLNSHSRYGEIIVRSPRRQGDPTVMGLVIEARMKTVSGVALPNPR